MNENLTLEPTTRLPRQVAAAGEAARNLLKAETEAPAPSPPPAPPAVPSPPPFTLEQLLAAPDETRNASRDYWFARAQAVEGFRRDDNGRSKARIESLEAQIRKLTEKNTELVKTHPAAQPAVNLKDHFTDEQIEFIGEDRALAIIRAILKTGSSTEAALNEVREEIAALKKKQLDEAEDEATRRHRLFIEGLDAGFPTWQATNQDPRWLTWLNGADENNGARRQDILDMHSRAKNASGIVKMLNAFLASLAPAVIPPTPPETPASLAGNGADNPPSLPPGVADGKLLTETEIKEGYRLKAIGKMKAEDAKLFDARVAAQMARTGRA